MRNIPFAFIDEETIARINTADLKYRQEKSIDGFAHLAQTQQTMRGLMTWPESTLATTVRYSIGRAAKHIVAIVEKMMEMSGPNSIANLERALRAHDQKSHLR